MFRLISVQLEQCNIKFKMISIITAHWYEMWNTIIIAISFCNGKKMICALMFIISNHFGIKCLMAQCYDCLSKCLAKCLSNQLMAQCYDFRNTIVIAINFCYAKKMICALMFIISNHYE